jgi:PAS domain S-box-containing protein
MPECRKYNAVVAVVDGEPSTGQGLSSLTRSATLRECCVSLPALRTQAVLLFFLLARCAFALDPSLDISQYAHTAWKVRDGFAKGFLYSIAQTPDGYLWLGTEFGLLRFDGVLALPWQAPTGQKLPGMDIPTLLVTRGGALWIGTFNGLARSKDGKLTTYAELSGQHISSLLQARDGGVWIGTRAGKLCVFQNERMQCDDGVLGATVRSLYEDARGNLFVGLRDGFWKWKPDRSGYFALPDEHLDRSFGEDKSSVLIGTQVGLRSFVNGRVKPYTLPGLPHRFRASQIMRDRDGGLWIATLDRGLLHHHNGKTDEFSEADGLSGDTVKALYEDREGNIWVVTPNGLDRFRHYSVPNIRNRQGLSNTDTLSVLAAKDGSVWIATYNGVNRWKDGGISVFGRSAGVPKAEGTLTGLTHSLFQASSGRIWVSTLRQTGYLEGNRFVPVLNVRGGWVFSTAEVPSGHLWLAVEQMGLVHLFKEKVVETIPWAAAGHKDHARVLLADRSRHGLWLGFAQGGVVYFADGRIQKSYSAAEGLGHGRVNGLRFGADGALWAATEGGVSRIKDGRITTLTSKTGLPCEIVHWSIEDDERSLWLYMGCGLVRIPGPELDGWIADPTKRVKYILFDASDGVRVHSYPSEPNSVAKSSDGRIWFVAFDGVSVIDPRHLPYNNVPPPVHIEGITANGRRYGVQRGMSLPPLIHDLTIDFTALSLAAPEKVHFRFQLDGQDHDWRVAVNKRQVQYSNLAPGKYVFRVAASNNSGVWNEQGDVLDFSIAPAYYQTNWFRIVCAAAFLTLLWVVWQFRSRQLQRNFKRLRDMIETIPAIAWTALPDGSNEFVNKRWVEYTGLSAEDTAGSGWTAAVHPEDHQRFLKKWHASLATGEPFEAELRVRCAANGDYRWLLARGVPLRDKHGKILRWYGVLTDIEDRKRAEQEHERVHQLELELAHINRVGVMGELAASIAHEVNQPLAGIVSNGSACLRWLAGDPPDVQEVREAVRDIVRDGKRAGDVIAHIRALTKRTAPAREKLDLNDTVQEVLALVGDEAKKNSVRLRSDFANDLGPVAGDRVQLQQVVLNLVMNAVEAMSGVEDRRRELFIRTRKVDADHVQVSVEDSGPGLDANTATRIFEPFYTTKAAGMGMGLSISRSIVQNHGGRLWATANNGPGASFHFSLPKYKEKGSHAGVAAV